MAEIKWLSDTGRILLINTDAVLNTGSAATGTYDNGTELDMIGDVHVVANWTVAPAADVRAAELWIMGSDPDDSSYPDGDTTDDPQDFFYIGSVVTVKNANGILGIPDVVLKPHTNKTFLRNISGQQLAATWEVRFIPHKYQN